MQITVAHIGAKTPEPWAGLTEEYIRRLGPYATAGSQVFRSEAVLLDWMERQRNGPLLILMDSRGREVSSEGLAEFIENHRERATRHLVFAIGPADGWSAGIQPKAASVMSLGQMTMAHALARLVLAEQLYRAHTILAGHPYHSGH
jgi:23S rRNA (pseudouridine1915-N3)-methyltransferase